MCRLTVFEANDCRGKSDFSRLTTLCVVTDALTENFSLDGANVMLAEKNIQDCMYLLTLFSFTFAFYLIVQLQYY